MGFLLVFLIFIFSLVFVLGTQREATVTLKKETDVLEL